MAGSIWRDWLRFVLGVSAATHNHARDRGQDGQQRSDANDTLHLALPICTRSDIRLARPIISRPHPSTPDAGLPRPLPLQYPMLKERCYQLPVNEEGIST